MAGREIPPAPPPSFRGDTMAIPATADVQFIPGAGKLYVDSLVDPSGNPLNVLDIDVGFTVNGRLELPGWLSGLGLVRLSADEIGGAVRARQEHSTPLVLGAGGA